MARQNKSRRYDSIGERTADVLKKMPFGICPATGPAGVNSVCDGRGVDGIVSDG